MKDRFLYRAYIKSRKEMVYLRGFEIKISECGKFETITLYYKNGGFEVCSLNDVILMQCTGLTDKNGKLIYEGDIMTSLYWEGKKATVKWNNDKGCFQWIGEGFAYNAWQTLYRKDISEIIGNIYETPELLQKEV